MPYTVTENLLNQCFAKVRIYGRPQVADKFGYAAMVSAKIHAWFEQDSDIPYALEKMGMYRSLKK